MVPPSALTASDVVAGGLTPLSAFPAFASAPIVPAVVDTAIGWLWTIVLFALPGVVAAALWTHFLIASRFRALFVALPPAGRLVSSYVGVALALSVPYLVGIVLTVGLVDSAGPGWSEGFLDTALFGGVIVGFVAPAFAVLGLPRVGVDWDPTGYGPGTWGLLVTAGLWYALVAAVPLVALAIGMALPGGY
ncbi:hypothetical protein FK85_00655 [Halorubrum saccharovorum]|uniref:DUF8162 domain-containing protein n=1 Tax=Halorubrum saccharovorum TaxID=2248 RepID=A0A081EVW8_9EURY|nr:hypothetical protein [Halorubrum saccharovorum]KDS91556.1 hypothetical protein FK85_00655 [Halorubrum saccharovorum]